MAVSFKKSILVTGGAGFIGSHVVRLFVNKYPEYRIVNLDKLTYAGNLANLKDIEDKPNYTFFKADVTYSVNNNLRFTLEADNLLNTRKYVSFINSDMTEHYSVYHIRPRSIMLRAAIGI